MQTALLPMIHGPVPHTPASAAGPAADDSANFDAALSSASDDLTQNTGASAGGSVLPLAAMPAAPGRRTTAETAPAGIPHVTTATGAAAGKIPQAGVPAEDTASLEAGATSEAQAETGTHGEAPLPEWLALLVGQTQAASGGAPAGSASRDAATADAPAPTVPKAARRLTPAPAATATGRQGLAGDAIASGAAGAHFTGSPRAEAATARSGVALSKDARPQPEQYNPAEIKPQSLSDTAGRSSPTERTLHAADARGVAESAAQSGRVESTVRAEVDHANPNAAAQARPAPQAVQTAPAPQAVQTAPAPQAVQTAPALQAVQTAPAPQGVQTAPALQTARPLRAADAAAEKRAPASPAAVAAHAAHDRTSEAQGNPATPVELAGASAAAVRVADTAVTAATWASHAAGPASSTRPRAADAPAARLADAALPSTLQAIAAGSQIIVPAAVHASGAGAPPSRPASAPAIELSRSRRAADISGPPGDFGPREIPIGPADAHAGTNPALALTWARALEAAAQSPGPAEPATGSAESLGAVTASSLSAIGSQAADASGTVPLEARVDAALQSPEFAPMFGARIATLARDGIEQARIALNPAEMGPVSVQLELSGTQVRVELAAEIEATRVALEQALPALAGSLREAGFTLAGGGVFQQARGDTSDQGNSENRGPSGGSMTTGDPPGLVVDGSLSARTGGRAPRGLVDLYA